MFLKFEEDQRKYKNDKEKVLWWKERKQEKIVSIIVYIESLLKGKINN